MLPIRSTETGEVPPPHVGRKLSVLGYFASGVIWLPVAFGLLFVYGFFNHAVLAPRMAEGFERDCVASASESGLAQGLKGGEAGLRRYCNCTWRHVEPQVGRMDTALSQISFGVVRPTPPQERIAACITAE